MALSVAVCATPGLAATLNGDFETGDLTGWSVAQSANSGASVEAQTVASNSFAQLSTGSAQLGTNPASISQTMKITEMTALLTFDAALVADEADRQPGGPGLMDVVGFFFFDDPGVFYRVYGYIPGGGGINPFGSMTGNPESFTTLTAPSDDGFDVGVSVDLTSFIGQELLFGFDAFATNDGTILTARFDNVAFSQIAPSVVSLPATLPLGLAAFAALGLLRRRRVPA